MQDTPKFVAKVFAKPLDNVLDAMETLIQQPNGCFEQTSSTTYPMVMALKLLNELENSITDPEEIERVKEMKQEILEKLRTGFEKLQTFETSTRGYEWFGDAPGHETLTAYGLAQFRDMRAVTDFVSEDTIERNQRWLLERKGGNGQFKLNERALDTFGRAAQNISDAYIVWVLTEEGVLAYADLESEFENLRQISRLTDDPYFLALYSGALFNVGLD